MPRDPSQKWVLGYILTEESVLRRGLQKNLGTAEDEEARSTTMIEAIIDVWVESGYEGLIKWTGVVVNKKICRCLTLATNDPEDCMMRKPSQEDIDKWKKVLNTELEPKWYKYA